MTDDSRYRSKVWIDTYLAAAYYATMGHIYLDNGTTEALTPAMYSLPNVPLKLLFFGTLNYDAVFTIGEPSTTVTQGCNQVAYKYHEEIPINIYAVDKTGLTAVKVLWQAELKLRKIAETYANGAGTLRVLRRTKPTALYLGGFFLYSVECVLSYTRSSEVTPTLPTLTWGPSASPTGTFIFPNVISKKERYVANNIYMDMPGRSGSYPQKFGTKSLEVEMICDLDMNPWSGDVADTKISWKRPQTTGTKTDYSNWQVFQDIWHEGGESEAYQKLTLEWGWFYVCMDEPVVSQDGGRTLLTVVFHEYNASIADTDYRHRLGITH